MSRYGMSGGVEKVGGKVTRCNAPLQKTKSFIRSPFSPLFRLILLCAKRGFTIDKKCLFCLFSLPPLK